MGMPNRFLLFNSSSKLPYSVKSSLVSALLCLLLILETTVKAEEHDELYAKYCKEFVPASNPVQDDFIPLYSQLQALGFGQARYDGGESLFNSTAYSWNPQSKYVSFSVPSALKTDQEGVFKISGLLNFRSRRFSIPLGDRGSRKPFGRTRLPKVSPRIGGFTVSADGFWSNLTHRVCLIGSGYRYWFNHSTNVFPVAIKFSYPGTSTILNSLITGTVESIEKEINFNPIRIIGVYDGVYEYTKLEDAKRVCSGRTPDVLDANIDVLRGELSVAKGGDICEWYWLKELLELKWNGSCSGSDCSPFNVNDKKSMPNDMLIQHMQCGNEGKVHGIFGFSASWNPIRYVLPENILIGEGQWDEERGQLCMVACRIMDTGRNPTEKDCGISISMQFPVTFTVVSSYMVMGHVQSDKKVDDPMYFKDFTFRGPSAMNGNLRGYRSLPGLKYEYTKLDLVKEKCSKFFTDRKKSLQKKSGRKYPDGNIFSDLGFDASIQDSDKQKRYGSVYPFTIGNNLVDGGLPNVSYKQLNVSYRQLNVSFNLQFWQPIRYTPNGVSAKPSAQEMYSISAEGIYEPQTGALCMIGCRHVSSLVNGSDGDMDCEILIDVEYAPTNPEYSSKEHLRGNIRSLRKENDTLYFKPMKLSSNNVYRRQASGAIWRKDLEIIMGLISLSFTALFIIAQLLYIRKHSNSLPFVSLLMLTVLTLGHMIPLVLNFEALFMNQKDRNVIQLSGGWVEVNEVVVRVMTMAAFLLQLRLLQLAWTARHNAAGEKSAWFWEKKVLYFCLPLYALGALIASLVHWMGQSNSSSVHFLQRHAHHSLWEDFRSYAGLILDGFLLPQILGNLFWDIRETVLVPYFYIGITVVRSMPHVYDAYRVIRYIPEYSSSYFYANPVWDFYSTAWDIVIPCGALLLALLVFLQQRFGGRCIIPQRFRDHLEYQKIPIVEGQ
ncbi:hypothetical protein SUGI_0295350 [Cryptomeria japonica]|uniref:uncharacterized protein LOC131078356 n=1 Tax=Cryptomeria japonica TaxID=3369 RepID=UPI002408A878|nr:uncharacterized protein LOC131078356 [Cryptomeria japonica]GLJ17071.1 hypothetical protein SUGI_0295350 [Cryptomeria japonica]